MAITYEEALATLEAMFGEPWTRDTLDAVLRHEKGHMENTCERILNHGEKNPQSLVDSLTNGDAAGAVDNQTAMDAALAQQLSGNGTGTATAAATSKKGRGTPTQLPKDFLRIPGYKYPRSAASRGTGSAATNANAGAGAPMDDETLARMLQDEMFSEEVARNPDLAHLTRGGGRGRSAATTGRGGGRTRASNVRGPKPMEGVNVMENLSKLGEGARRRLQMFANNFESRLNGGGGGRKTNGSSATNGDASRGNVLQEDSGAVAERRGLLDDDFGEEEIEFEMREKKS